MLSNYFKNKGKMLLLPRLWFFQNVLPFFFWNWGIITYNILLVLGIQRNVSVLQNDHWNSSV